MTKLQKRLVSAVAAGVLLVQTVAPAFAAADYTIAGNGAGADNNITSNSNSNTTVQQTNSAYVSNNISVDNSTGGNEAKFNTGGATTVVTGDTSANVQVQNALNKNIAVLNCCNSQGDTSVTISGNGAKPTNKDGNTVTLNSNNTTGLFQTNGANVTNNVSVEGKTGKNDANYNTGGTVDVVTGNTSAVVGVTTAANANIAQIGGIGSGAQGSSLTLGILGNGAGSDNNINVNMNRNTAITQGNSAYVTNDVGVEGSTGKNDANFNTGGDVTVVTGNAKAIVGVANELNFNVADVNCGCFGTDTIAKIKDNGANSDNAIW